MCVQTRTRETRAGLHRRKDTRKKKNSLRKAYNGGRIQTRKRRAVTRGRVQNKLKKIWNGAYKNLEWGCMEIRKRKGGGRLILREGYKHEKE